MTKKESMFSIQETAKITNFPGGQKKFFAWLREKKYLQPNNEPYQKYIDNGWFQMTTATLYKTKAKQVVPVTLVKLKGAAALEQIILKEFPPCIPCNQIFNQKNKKP